MKIKSTLVVLALLAVVSSIQAQVSTFTGLPKGTDWYTFCDAMERDGAKLTVFSNRVIATTDAAADTTVGDVISDSVAFGADPADAGVVRLENAAVIGWEASAAGTDVTLTVNSSEQFVFSAAILNPTFVGPTLGVATGTSMAATAGITSSGPTGAGIGYATGAGGVETQATSRTTTLVQSTLCGQITTDAASMAAQAPTTFTATNTTVAATDVVIISKVSGDVDTFAWVNSVAAGSFTVTLFNTHASEADTTAFVFNYAVIRGVSN